MTNTVLAGSPTMVHYGSNSANVKWPMTFPPTRTTHQHSQPSSLAIHWVRPVFRQSVSHSPGNEYWLSTCVALSQSPLPTSNHQHHHCGQPAWKSVTCHCWVRPDDCAQDATSFVSQPSTVFELQYLNFKNQTSNKPIFTSLPQAIPILNKLYQEVQSTVLQDTARLWAK